MSTRYRLICPSLHVSGLAAGCSGCRGTSKSRSTGVAKWKLVLKIANICATGLPKSDATALVKTENTKTPSKQPERRQLPELTLLRHSPLELVWPGWPLEGALLESASRRYNKFPQQHVFHDFALFHWQACGRSIERHTMSQSLVSVSS